MLLESAYELFMTVGYIHLYMYMYMYCASQVLVYCVVQLVGGHIH